MRRLSATGIADLLSADTINTFRFAHWNRFKQAPNNILTPEWRRWVLASGSLTQRLIKASGGNFRVQVQSQHWARPWPSEQLILGLANGEHAWIREVALVCQGQPWVQARTVIPASTLKGPRRRLQHLGETPLGAYLFKCRDMRRGALEIAPLQPVGTPKPLAWGRRSLFFLSDHPLLVSEFFLPQILAANVPVTNDR